MTFDLSKLARYPAPIRLMVFILTLLLLWLPLAVPIQWLVGRYAASPAEGQNTATLLTLPLLYIEFIVLARFWGRRVYRLPNLLWRYGLEFSQRSGKELLMGLAIGLLSLLGLFLTQGLLNWLVWFPASGATAIGSPSLPRVIIEGLLVALAFGFAEELLFRGWLLDELQRDYHPNIALWVDAVIFALVHGLRPQFPALVLLGATLVWAKRSQTSYDSSQQIPFEKVLRSRLALPMGLHAGLVWGYYIINVGQLVKYTHRAPVWITGIDHNPLAGLAGLLFLGILAFAMRYRSQRGMRGKG